MTSTPNTDRFSLAAVISGLTTERRLRELSPSAWEAAEGYWRAPLEVGALTPRVAELVLLAMHATPTALNVDGIGRHIERGRAAGASEADIMDVLLTVSAVANHALYFAVPVLEEEMEAAGIEEPDPEEVGVADFDAAKQDFIAARGFWNPDRDRLARLMPRYFRALNRASTETWKNGSLSAKERAFVCIAIDSTVTHNYEPGLRRHIRNALLHGATKQEILQIFQLGACLGLEGYVLGARSLLGDRGTAEEASA